MSAGAEVGSRCDGTAVDGGSVSATDSDGGASTVDGDGVMSTGACVGSAVVGCVGSSGTC